MADGIKIDDLYFLMGYKVDQSSKARADDHLAGTKDELGRWAGETADMMGAVFEVQFLSDLYEGVRDLAVGMIASLSPRALIERADEWSALADEVNKTSKDIGLSGEAWQTWQFIARRTGTDIDELRNSFNKIGLELGNAAAGSKEKRKLFSDLGLDVEQLLAMDPAQRLEEVTEALRRIPDDTTRLSLGAKLFGEDALRKMTRLLNASSEEVAALKAEARDLGIIDQSALDQASAFQDTLANLRQVGDASASTFTMRYLPALDEMLVQFTELMVVARPFVDEILGAPVDVVVAGIEGMGVAVRTLREWLGDTPEEVDAIVEAFGGWTNVGHTLVGVLLTIGAAWGALKAPAIIAGFAKLGAVLAPIVSVGAAPLLAIVLALAAVLGIANDIYTFFTSKDANASIFGRLFGLDPKVAADVERAKKIVGVLLRMFNPLLILPLALYNNWGELRVFLGDLLAFLIDQGHNLVDWVAGVFGVAPSEIYSTLEALQEKALEGFNLLIDGLIWVWDLIDDGVLFVLKVLFGVLAGAFLLIMGILAGVAAGIATIVDLAGPAIETIKRYIASVEEAFSRMGQRMSDFFDPAYDKIMEMLDSVREVMDLFSDLDLRASASSIATRVVGELVPSSRTAGLLPAGASTRNVSVGNGDRTTIIDARGRDIEEVKEEYDEGFFDVDLDYLSQLLDDDEEL